jgi:acyl carrier protein
VLDQRLCEIVRDIVGDDELVLDETTTAADVEGWDSLAHINIMVAVESAYGVSFTSDELSRFRDLGELQEFLTRRAS